MNGNNNDFENRKNFRKNKRNSEGKRPIVFMTIVVFIFTLIALMAVCIAVFRPNIDDSPPAFGTGTGSVSSDSTNVTGTPVVKDSENDYKRKEGYYTFLVCGTDKISRGTDVMMLVSLDTKNGSVNVIQIPRDTFVNGSVVGYNITRVNSIYAAAYNISSGSGKAREKNAMTRLCEEIESSLCVRIDRYVLMDTEAFVNIIDAIGGVDYNIPFDMDYDDPDQGLYIHLKAGMQRLDGKAAEQFIRFRAGYATGDIGRVEARADFLKAVYSQVRENMSVSVAVNIAKQIIDYMTTDISIEDAVFFVSAIYGIDSDDFNVKTLSGSALMNPETGKWSPYYALNKKLALEDINKYMNVFTSDITYSVFDSKALFTDDPKGKNPYISEYYYS